MVEVTNKGDSNVSADETMEEDNTNISNVANTDAEEDTPKHPYHVQLAEFQPNAWQLEERYPRMYLSLEDTKLTMVDSQELLDEMMTKLKQVKEFAIDLENHTYHSFIGFICVFKISTRTEDFIVDAIKLKEEMTVLNEVFTDPNILKVFHAGDKDILCLQRDFGIYVVNMFDTLVAAKSFTEQLSLSRVLKEICDIDLDKKYQIDWRVRPLPPDMINQARKDTHYLLYLCDTYTNKCLHLSTSSDTAVDVLKTVYERSTELCGLVYAPPEYKADSYKADYDMIRGTLSVQQLECFRLLHEWRYNTAREQNESIRYTFPSRRMFHISKQLPRKAEDITPSKTLPPLVEQNITQVLTLVKKAINYIPNVGNKNEKKKLVCFRCQKHGHNAKDCNMHRFSHGKRHVDPQMGGAFGVGFGNPRGDFHRGAFGFGNPRGDFHRAAFGGGLGSPRGNFHMGGYGGGYGSRGFKPIPPPYSGYEGAHSGYDHFPGYQPILQPYSQTYGPIRPRFKHFSNPRHPYL